VITTMKIEYYLVDN